jgi:hypothetical protein
MAKYTDANAAMEAALDAQKKVGRPYWLPDDHSKLTDDQKNEIRANVAKMENVPDNADGYVYTKGKETKVPIDEQGIADFKVFCKENKIPQSLFDKLTSFQEGFTDRIAAKLNEDNIQAIKKINAETAEKFNKDCGGEANAVLRTTWIKEYLQSFCKDDNGEPDKDMWEAFLKRQFPDDRGTELVLLRALSEPAQKARGTGGAPPGTPASAVAAGALDYPEMKKK